MCIRDSYHAMKKGFTKYSNPAGLFELRKEVAKKLLVENNIRAKLEEIIITPGSKMALSLVLMSIIKPNDELIYFSPAYTSYVPQMLLSENKIIITKASGICTLCNKGKPHLQVNDSQVCKACYKKIKSFES